MVAHRVCRIDEQCERSEKKPDVALLPVEHGANRPVFKVEPDVDLAAGLAPHPNGAQAEPPAGIIDMFPVHHGTSLSFSGFVSTIASIESGIALMWPVGLCLYVIWRYGISS